MRSHATRVEIAAVNPRRGGAVLVTVLVACVLVLSAQAPARGGRGTVLQSWFLSLSAPVAGAVGGASRTVSGTIESTVALFGAREENARLKRELDARERELFRLRAEALETAEDRRLLGAGSALPSILGSVPLLLVERRAGAQSVLVGVGGDQGTGTLVVGAEPLGEVGLQLHPSEAAA